MRLSRFHGTKIKSHGIIRFCTIPTYDTDLIEHLNQLLTQRNMHNTNMSHQNFWCVNLTSNLIHTVSTQHWTPLNNNDQSRAYTVDHIPIIKWADHWTIGRVLHLMSKFTTLCARYVMLDHGRVGRGNCSPVEQTQMHQDNSWCNLHSRPVDGVV